MKEYYKYLDEISKENLLEALIGYGMFSEQLPSMFSGEKFYNFLKINFFNKNKPLSFSTKNGKDYVRYENILSVNIPRQLSIPNPFAHAKLCKIITDNWNNLKAFFKQKTEKHKFKISRIHIRKLAQKKHLFEMNYKNFFLDGDPVSTLLIGKRFIVKTDISNCFGSIYSHSIPWSIKGKEISKENRNHWVDEIDKAIRGIKYNETNGLLIGPHVSNLISEIILCSIDDELYQKGYRLIRNIDDYECFVETFEKGEMFLMDLSKELRKYNLSLNLKKTFIKKLPLALNDNWVSQLNSHIFLEHKNIRLSSIKNFWNFVINLFENNDKNAAIFNYAMRIISKKKLNQYAQEYHINKVHHLAILYPYLVTLLDKLLFKPFPLLTKEKILLISNDIFANGKAKNLFESMSYALFFALKYNFKIKEHNLYSLAENSNDAVLMVLAYLYDKKNHNKNIKIYRELALKLKDKGEEDKFWIFIFEVLPQSKLKGDYKSIKKNRISFIKDKYYA